MSFKAQPGQIRTCASTHTALMKDGWRRSGHQDMGAELWDMGSTFRRPERVAPISSERVGCGEPKHFATVD
jgi:hypothetical protein